MSLGLPSCSPEYIDVILIAPVMHDPLIHPTNELYIENVISSHCNSIHANKLTTYLHEFGIATAHVFEHVSSHVFHAYLHNLYDNQTLTKLNMNTCITMFIYTIGEVDNIITWEMGSSGHNMREIVFDLFDGRIFSHNLFHGGSNLACYVHQGI